MTASQQSSSEEVVSILKQCAYHFKRKGNEAQFVCNSAVEERMQSAKWELGKLTTTNTRDRATIKKETLQLEEGLKAIICRQKHIKVGPLDELVSDSEDEKRLFKDEKEAERRSKRKWAGTAGPRRRASFTGASTTAPRPSGKGEASSLAAEAAWQESARPRALGPCYSCGQWGHIAQSCLVRIPKGTYLFQRPVVSSTIVCSDVLSGEVHSFCHISTLECESLSAGVQL